MMERHAMPGGRAWGVAGSLLVVAVLLALAILISNGGWAPGSGRAPSQSAKTASPASGGSPLLLVQRGVDPSGEYTDAFLARMAQGAEKIDLAGAKARAGFPLQLPATDAMPGGGALKLGLVLPSDNGEGFDLYFAGGVKIVVTPVDETPSDYLEGELARKYNPDFTDRAIERNESAPMSVGGVPAFGHDPFDQKLPDGSVNHVPGLVGWEVPGAKAGQYVRYRVFGEKLSAAELIKIAESMK